MQFNQGSCKLFKIFYDNYSCLRCILRLFKVQEAEHYISKNFFIQTIQQVSQKLQLQEDLIQEYDFNNLIRKSQQQLQNPNNTCRLCLGILQQIDQKHFIDEIENKIKSEDYHIEDFVLQVQHPHSLNLRFLNLLYYGESLLKQELQDQKDIQYYCNNWTYNHINIKTAIKFIGINLLEQRLQAKFDNKDGKLQILLNFQNQSDEQTQFQYFSNAINQMTNDYKEKIQKKIKSSEYIRKNNNRILEIVAISKSNLDKVSQMPNQTFLEQYQNHPPTPIETETTVEFSISHSSVYIIGSYCKLQRYLPQSEWLIDNKKLYASSVEQEISQHISPNFLPDKCKFSGGGREDIDVRMLGKGRPFVIEVQNPRRYNNKNQIDIKQIEQNINTHSKYISVNSMSYTDVSCFDQLKESEIEKIKSYACFIQFTNDIDDSKLNELNFVKDMIIKQKTPIRVLQRRAVLVREKVVHKLKAFKLNNRHVILYVLASAGTYIKEFIHGDLERTTPNIGQLMNNDADIFQLDVVSLYEKLTEESLKDFDDIANPTLQK